MSRLQGKRIVITGSSRGLGRAFAIACAGEGASVIINGTNQEALSEAEQLIQAAGGNVRAIAGSVADEAICKSLIDGCVETFGGVDVVVNNAGIVRDKTLMKMSVEDFDAVIAVNLRGAFSCTKHAALAMREGGGGQIIQVISAAGLTGGFGQGNYAASKAGMMGILRCAVQEFSRFNIRNNAIWPVAETDMTQVVFNRANAAAKDHNTPAPTPVEMGFGKPEEVAQGLVWLASDAAAHFDGQCVSFNGRKTAIWSHPAEQHVTFHDGPWTADELDEHYRNIEPQPIYRPPMIKP
ncbi:MAG: SDR family NAD(P)-dependent oxidoreductase [Pseudomonadales bacterium]|jgi:NAD(P)-dependent dehydrogenase (short-subunit alcohol dehydrogenase family)